MSSYRNNYSNSGSGDYNNYRSSSNYNNNATGSYSSSNNIPASRRPDGSYREEVRVRPGYVPDGERQSYVPPPARNNYSGYSSGNTGNAAISGVEDRVDSWADEEAPVLSEHSEYESNDIEGPETETKKEETVETAVTETVKESSDTVVSAEAVAVEAEDVETAVPETSESPAPREPRKPSQLATAIDTAIDSLSINSGTGENGTPRQIGRFAAQIANDEREGRTYTPRRYDSSSSSGGYYQGGGYNRNDYGRGDNQGGYNRDYRSYNNTGSWNRNSSYNSNRDANEEITSSSAANGSSSNNTLGNSSGVGHSSGDIRAEKEFKSFLEQLNALRREMAVINAKLEYIRYFKNLDLVELSEAERSRLVKEKELVARMDAIFVAIEALALKQ